MDEDVRDELDAANLQGMLAMFEGVGASQRDKARVALQVADLLTPKDLALCSAFGINPLAILAERAAQADEAKLQAWRERERREREKGAQGAIARHQAAERERMKGLVG